VTQRLTGSFAAADVHYPASGGGRAAVVVAADPTYSNVVAERVAVAESVEPYRPGQFYLRELPPLLAVLQSAGQLDLVVVDGYVDLDPDGRMGLGAHVHQELGIPVIGAAKTVFRTATHAVPVRRGRSAKPLYVTAAGMAPDRAAGVVAAMSGKFRIPDALRRADALARGGASR